MWQQASDTPLQDFTWELDFASLPISSGARSLGVATYRKDAGETVDAICLYDVGGGSAELKFYNGSVWVSTGLYANITPDTGTVGVFDGEDPSAYMNHLKFTATEYGTTDQGITITLNGNSYSLSDAAQKESIKNVSIKTFGLFSQGYLVDNVSMTGTPLIPAAVSLTAESLLPTEILKR